MKILLHIILVVSVLGMDVYAQQPAQPFAQQRDTSYTLQSALAKAKKHNKQKDIVITGVYSNPSKEIKTEKDITYKTINADRKLSANLFYPLKKKKEKIAALLIIHGGGWRSGDKSLMTPMAEKLSAAGYFVMAPEYRLSLEAPYPAAVLDLYNALQWMHDHADDYNIDMDKIVVMGCSAGGQLATLVGTTYNKPTNVYQKKKYGKIAAIVDVDGVLAFIHPDSQESEVAAQWLGGSTNEVPEKWQEASALNHVDGYTPPTLFLASMFPRFLAGRQDYIEKLKPYNTSSATYFLDRAPHSFWLFNPWFEPTVKHILKFLDKELK